MKHGSHRAHPLRPSRRTDRPTEGSVRTCLGCGRADRIDALIRLVVSADGQLVVDLAGRATGRGARVHPTARCLALAPRGLAKSFRRSFDVTPASLSLLVAKAADERAAALLVSARRAGKARAPSGARMENSQERLWVIARDTTGADWTAPMTDAIAHGGAVAWGTKVELGALLGKSEVEVLEIASPKLSAALRSAMGMASSVASGGGASRVTRPAMGTEDR